MTDQRATLIKGGKVLKLGKEEISLEEEDIFLENGKISSIVKSGTFVSKEKSYDIIDAREQLVMPGFVNAHNHSKSAITKMARSKDNTNAITALWYGIAHAMNRTPRELYVSALVNSIQMLKTGTTCVVDQFYEAGRVRVADLGEIESVVNAYEDVGMRALVALDMFDQKPKQILPRQIEKLPKLADELFSRKMKSLEELEELYHEAAVRWHGSADGRIKIIPATPLPNRCSDDLLLLIDRLSSQYDTISTTHVLEHKKGVETAQSLWGRSEIEHLADIGVLSPRFCITHAVWVTDKDIELIAKYGVSVLHCPELNIRLGGGVARVPEMIKAGVNVALGADSATNQIMFDVMKLTGIVHRIDQEEPDSWVYADQIVKMATENGALALGMSNQIGSLEVGKDADIVLLDLNSVWLNPLTDLACRLVYFENGSSVDTVIVGGKIVVQKGKLLTIDEEAILQEAREIFYRLEDRNEELYQLADQMSDILASEKIAGN